MFQTMYNPFDSIPVKKDHSSNTVPDMSYTPREIIQKFSRGERVPLGFEGLFDAEDSPDSLGGYDPAIFEEDPTRDPEFDFGDYVEEKHALEQRQAAARRAARAKGVAGSKRKASAEESSASEAMTRETTSGEPATPPSVGSNG